MVQDLFVQVEDQPGYSLKIDLPNQNIMLPNGTEVRFEVESFRKHCLVNGLDDIGLTLQQAELIKEYERRRQTEAPWLFVGQVIAGRNDTNAVSATHEKDGLSG